MKTKCLIVDDEPLAIEVIEAHIQKFDDMEIVDKCTNAIKAFEILRQKDIDLIFLDIQMPKLTGLEFLRTLKNPPKVIITTAYREYAVEGYELDIVDYLLKPISFERFLKAIHKYYQTQSPDFLIYNESENAPSMEQSAFFYVKSNKKIFKIYLNDIIYIESLKDYVKIVTSTNSVVTKQQISNFEEKLPSQKFIRIHRSFIVSIPKIGAFTATTVELEGKELPIGRSYKNAVFETLKIDEDLI